MGKKSVTVKAAWIGVFGTILASAIVAIVQFWQDPSLKIEQSGGDIKENITSTTGDHSPITFNSQNIQAQTVQHFHQTVVYSNVMERSEIVTNVVYIENPQNGVDAKFLEDIYNYEKRTGIAIPIPTNGIARIKTPQKAFEINDALTTAYNTGNIPDCFTLASEGTNLYANLVGVYDEIISVDGTLLQITAECYGILAEYSMYKKDFPAAVHLIRHAQGISPLTNALFVAIEAASLQQAGQDDNMSLLLGYIKENFPEPLRFETVNLLTRMGYLHPYKVQRSASGKWELVPDHNLKEYFKLTQDLTFPLILRCTLGDQMTNPTMTRWIGMNQYEPVDLVRWAQKVIEDLESGSLKKREKTLQYRVNRFSRQPWLP